MSVYDSIRSISDIAGVSSSGVFVRFVGEYGGISADITALDGRCGGYLRISGLPQFGSSSDTQFYTAAYDSGRGAGRIDIRFTAGNGDLGRKLFDACEKTVTAFRTAHRGTTPSSERSFAVKLLYRLDAVFAQLPYSAGMKIVCPNVSKLQEYLCFYAMTLLGANVFLIQNKHDIDEESKNLAVSHAVNLGGFGSTELPPFVRPARPANAAAASAQASGSGNIRITLPPRKPKNGSQAARQPAVTHPSAGYQNSNNNTQVRQPVAGNAQTARQPVVTQPSAGYQNSNNSTQVRQPVAGNAQAARQPAVAHPSAGYQNGNDNTQVRQPVGRAPIARTEQIQRPSQNTGFTPIQRPSQNAGFTPIQRPSRNIGFAPIQRPENIAYTPITAVQPQQRPELSYEELALRASSVVQILVIASPSDIRPNGEFRARGSGSGVMIGEDGYIVTNCHVAAGGKVFAVKIENDDRIYFTDRLVKYHDRYDLAVLRIDRRLQPLPIYSGSKPLARGQRVVAIGSPLGLFNTVSDGIISGFRRVDGVEMIQFTAPISSGSSGGAVLNMYGEVIGISTAGIETDDGTAQNINLAVGCDTIRNFCGGFAVTGGTRI